MPDNERRYFGDYELLEEIARGGMGIVYRARQLSLNRIVALKMIPGGKLANTEDLQRFRCEAEAIANLDHPNIVSIYEVGEHEGQQYFTMKFVEGGSLVSFAASRANGLNGPQSATLRRESVALIALLARAIHFAHQHGILHRDLKPANILLDADGQPHITDFGLAKNLKSESDITLSGVVIGTPAYMAPEQAAGRGKQVSTAADIYSLGAILYELLLGRPPFHGASVLEILRQVADGEPERPSTIFRRFDRDLDTICLKCLEKDPQRRYRSAEALADDLERWLRHEPILARRLSMNERLWKAIRRRPALAALIGTIVTALLAITGLSLSMSWRVTASQRATEIEADKSRQTAAFLKDIIQNVWPSAARGKDTEIFKDALQKIAQRLDTFSGPPEVEVDLRLTLARAHQELGLFKEQEEMSREAVRLAKAHWGTQHDLVAEGLISQAYALFILKRDAEALALYEELLAIRRNRHGSNHLSVAFVYSRMADVHISNGDRDTSERLWLEALSIQEKAGAMGQVGYSLLCLGRIAFERGSLAAAETKMQQALNIQTQVHGPDHPMVAEILLWLSRLAKARGDLAKAEELLQQTLAMRIKTLGAGSHQVAQVMISIGRLQAVRGHGKEAEETFRRALDIEKRAMGGEHEFVAEILVELARFHVSRGNLTNGVQLHREALAMREKLLGTNHERTVTSRSELEAALRRQTP